MESALYLLIKLNPARVNDNTASHGALRVVIRNKPSLSSGSGTRASVQTAAQAAAEKHTCVQPGSWFTRQARPACGSHLAWRPRGCPLPGPGPAPALTCLPPPSDSSSLPPLDPLLPGSDGGFLQAGQEGWGVLSENRQAPWVPSFPCPPVTPAPTSTPVGCDSDTLKPRLK